MNELLKENPNIESAITKIDEIMKESKRPILVALDGRSGTGNARFAHFEIAFQELEV
jgi:hypothetical protein